KLSSLPTPTWSGHDFSGWFTAANGGTQVTTNTVFTGSDTIYAHWAESHNHSYTGRVTKPATCTETGVMTYTCSCGDSYPVSIPIDPDNHDFDEGKITVPATVLSDGLKTFACSRCGATKTEIIPKLAPATENDKELAAELDQLIDSLKDESGEPIVDVDIKTEEKEDGTVETIVKIGDEEVVKIITDEDGDETIESNIWSIGGDEDYTYTGAAVKPEVTVYDGLKKLSEGSDYTLKYANNVNAGTKATITVGFTGGYKGTPAIKVTFTINQADLSKYATAQNMVIAANGRLQKPVPSITMTASGSNLGANILKYRYLDKDENEVPGIKDAGTYIVQAKAKKDNGNFTGIVSATIKVEADKTKLLSNAKVKLTKNKYLYTSGPITPEKGTYTLTLNGTDLEENKDYTIELKDNVNPGKATIIFNAVENEKGLVGSTKASFEITRGRVILPEGDGSAFTYTYDKSVTYEKAGVKPKVTVKDGKAILIEGKDYDVGYKNNKAIAKYNETDKRGRDIAPKIIITGKNNYKGSVTLPFAITGKDIDSIKGKITADDKAESKKGYKNPAITAYDGSILLRAKTDYEIDPESYKVTAPGSSETVLNPATAEVGSIITVDIIGKGNYTDRTTLSYRYVSAVSLLSKKGAARINAKAYTGKEITLTKKELNKLLYTGRGKNVKYLKYGEDFEIVRYENNLKPGTAKVIIRGINDHSGLRTLTFKINSAKKTGLKIIISKLVNK
ncbi:MAG: InlB B-repeat-containing protein, partial [Lachnospiraceae bacterium]|nr:InlB B-repeat-containing protein [Lachnospiraceae bacterium]